jgi:membrane-bound metal-dependent hydrolase YbcI (DUF457 family)
MRMKGHYHTGIAGGICTWLLMNHYQYDNKVALTVSGMFAVGSVAPDYLELGIIKHRTWTHWPVGWILIFMASYYGVTLQNENLLTFYGLGGLCMGAMLHILADMPYYNGTPLFNPRKRFPTFRFKFQPKFNRAIENVYIITMFAGTIWALIR